MSVLPANPPTTKHLYCIFGNLALLLALLACLTACNPVQRIKDRQQFDDLNAATDTFRKLIRWGYYDQAAKYVRARDGSAPTPDLAEAARFKVTHYTVTSTLVSDDKQDAEVVATIEYYELESGIAKTIRAEQFWWFEPAEKRWYLSSGLPDFVGGFR